MALWALITAAFLIQEFASAAIVLVLAQQANVPLWPIHIIWFGTTMADMYVGYILGTLVKNRFEKNRLMQRTETWMKKAAESLGKHGANIALLLLGIINFPYLNTFIASWLGTPLKAAFLFTLLGNFIWYLLLWGTVLGLGSFISNPSIILLIIVVIGVLSHFAFQIERTVRHRVVRRNKKEE